MVSYNNENTILISTINKKLYPIVFKWEGEAEKVYLTGSFCDWVKFYEMEKKENKFYFILFLQKGTYQYKFKVDSNWECNFNLPMCNDKNGNINNIINVDENKHEEITTDFSTSSISENKKNVEDIFDNSVSEISEIMKVNKSNYINSFEEKYDINNYTNNTYKKIIPIKNEFIEHLNIKKTNKSKCIVTSCSIKSGFKISTFVYYKPK